MAEEIGFENGRNSNFQGLDLGSGYTAYRRASLIDLCGRTDGHFPPILLGRLLEVDLKNQHKTMTVLWLCTRLIGL